MSKCYHCQSDSGCRPPRGLCWRCYRNPEIKNRFGLRKPGPKTGEIEDEAELVDDGLDPTEEELEAMIAEQLQSLPDWYDEDTARLREQRDIKRYILVRNNG